MIDILEVAAQVGLQYGPFVVALYLVFVIMSLPDLTVEGSFALGAAASASVVFQDGNPLLALLIAFALGAAAGLVTGLLHTRLRINALLAGILTTTAAWSVSLIVMGRGNIGLRGKVTLFEWIEDWLGIGSQWAAIWVGLAASVATAAALVWFLRTEFGLSLRATGRSIQTARGLGVRTERYQVVGLMLANGLAGLSGGLVAQNQGFNDVQSGVGVIVVGLAALALGSAMIRSTRLVPSLLGALLGIYLYRAIVAWTLRMGLPAGNIRLVTAAVVVVAIIARMQARGVFATEGRGRMKRQRIDYLENDRVSPIL